jgi:hypothetical protein
MKYIKGFFTFWFDFIVGDAWEVAAGVLITLVLLFAAVQVWGSMAAALGAFLLPLAVIAVLAVSFRRTSRST